MTADKKTVSVPQWLVAGIVPVIITVCGWVWTASQLTSKVEAATADTKILFTKVNEAGDLAKKHDTIIPRVEKRMDDMDAKLDKIYAAVK